VVLTPPSRKTPAARVLAALAAFAAGPASAAEADLLYYLMRAEIDVTQVDSDTLVTWDAEAWAGGDEDRVWLKSEGEVHGGTTEEGEVQLLFSRMISDFFNLQAGVRHDWQPSDLTYAVVGVEGLAPYFFETDAALFLSEDGDVSLRFEQSLDVLLTQRLVAEPYAEFNAYAADVPERAVGAGISDAELGLQLRYEIARKFAPYLDVSYTRALGETATLRRGSGADVEELTLRAGLRFWF
jgi:copper resistance protein B